MTALDTAALRDLLAGLTTVKTYVHGEKVWLYCGKAGREVEHTVMIYGDSKPFALCGYGSCINKAPDLPVRYETTDDQVAYALLDAAPALLDAAEAVQRAEAKAEDFEGRYETSHASRMWAEELLARTERERDEARATIERVQALADKWDRRGVVPRSWRLDIQVALGPQPTDRSEP